MHFALNKNWSLLWDSMIILKVLKVVVLVGGSDNKIIDVKIYISRGKVT